MRFRRILKIPFVIIKWIVADIPGTTGIYIRRLFYKFQFKNCGKNLIIDIGVTIEGAHLITVGDNVHIDKYTIISTGRDLVGHVTYKNNSQFNGLDGEILIGSNIHIVQNCILMGFGGIKIEDNVVISAGCKIYSLTNMAYDSVNRDKVTSIQPYSTAEFLASPINLCKNVWLGLNVIVMPGVSVGKDSFAVSNSLLMGFYDENSYISGQPATVKGRRFGK